MKDIEKLISPLVEKQFPSFYSQEGEQFIAFVKAYYEWLETRSALSFEAVNITDSGTSTASITTVNNPLTVGEPIVYYANGNTPIDGLVNGATYYATFANSTVISLGEYATAANIAISADGMSGTHYLLGDGHPLYHSRRLPEYRDIDSTLDDFIVHFKEKYLRNIQFDTATNKKLLIKNSLDLYRSKGTARSIDLFFKLVYGTPAEVNYPAENILRVSDGIWEKPIYLEVTYSQYNVDYVGKQIIGSLSGAKAFVEKYIRRRVGRGYVNLLYISGVEGQFRNGEVLGVNVNNVPNFNRARNAQLIGSVDRVTIQDGGQSFNVGDIVSFTGSARGTGGLARVEAIANTTGLIDFVFNDGGYGYTIDATSLISEKVVNFSEIVANTTSDQYFRLFEQAVQPLINVNFTSASAELAVGDFVYRYDGANNLVTTGQIVGVDQSGGNGNMTLTITKNGGVFTNNVSYYTASNAASFFANTIEDRTIGGKVMGIPTVYTIVLSGQSGNVAVGQNVYQKNTTAVFARGTVNSITQTAVGNVVVLINARGAFKNSKDLEDATYAVGTGTITANTTNNLVVGSGTAFNNNYIGAVLYQTPNTSTNVAIGTISSIVNSTALILSSNGSADVTANAHSFGPSYPMLVIGNTSIRANVETVSAAAGIYDIRKFINTIRYNSANTDDIIFGKKIYQYNTSGNIISEGLLLTIDHSNTTNTGNLTFVPIRGYFQETNKFYVDSNTAEATVVTFSTSNSGGDYIASSTAKMFTQLSNTSMTVGTISYGSGAGFGIGTIGDTEVIFIGTDLIGSNNVGTLDYDRKILTVASSSGFSVGDPVYQKVNHIGMNPYVAINAVSGFITLPNANTLFTVGDNIRYEAAAGNTVPNGFVSGDYYHVRFANSTGIILSYPYRKTDYINNYNFDTFANNIISEDGHWFYKQVYGTVFEVGTGVVKIKDRMNYFGNTSTLSQVGNGTYAANSNLISYNTPTTNTTLQNVTVYPTLVQANQAYASLPIRSAAYGFPKNPQGELADVIYSCLTFGRFEIGSIGSLDQVDPGSEYNVDPYVLAYQPYISAFNRNDLLITISNPTRNYVVGEKVNQTLPTLLYYDLEVDRGAYSNTYDEISTAVNSKVDVNGTAEFIYIVSNEFTFNSNTAVQNSNDFIVVAHDFASNDVVRYYTGSGNTAVDGLSNNTLYYVGYSNSTGLTLSSTPGGANLAINATSVSETGHFLRGYSSPYADDQRILYTTPAGNTAISGLANNTAYYIVSSNTIGIKLSLTKGGSAIDLTAAGSGETHYIATVPGYLPGDKVYQNVAVKFAADPSKIDNSVNAISLSPQPFGSGDEVLYYTDSGNTVITGLSNNTIYYVVGANSTTIKLSDSVGGTALDIDAIASTDVGQNIISVANAYVHAVFSNTSGDYVRVERVVNTLANTYTLYSYTNPYVDGTVANVSLYQLTSTAKGIVKAGSNTSVLRVKRLTFENTFAAGGTIIGDVSGSQATITGVSEDQDELYPIGLNAQVEANVVTANGTVTALQVIDSGFGYVNSEIVQYVSEDGSRAGSAKVVVDGLGEGRGYYRSSKGFLSEDMYIHDGDYYQEYSYEVLSKISVDRYADMFKKVMHVAGTKFFGSALVVEEANLALQYSALATGQQVKFNSALDVSSANETIQMDIEGLKYEFDALNQVNEQTDFITLTYDPTYNPQKLSNGDLVLYYSNTGNFVPGLANNTFYYVVYSNTSGIKVSNTLDGAVLDINTAGMVSEKHFIRQYINPFSNGDLVYYQTDTGNTAVGGLTNATSYFVVNTTPNTVKLSLTANGTPINITANTTTTGSNTAGHYLTRTVEE